MSPSPRPQKKPSKLTLDLSTTDTLFRAPETASGSSTHTGLSASILTPPSFPSSSQNSPASSSRVRRPRRPSRYSAVSLKPPPLLIDRDKKPYSPPQTRTPTLSSATTPNTDKNLPSLPSPQRPSLASSHQLPVRRNISAWSKSSASSSQHPSSKQNQSRNSSNSFKKSTRSLSDIVRQTFRISRFQTPKLLTPREMEAARRPPSPSPLASPTSVYDTNHVDNDLSDVDFERTHPRLPLHDSGENAHQAPYGNVDIGRDPEKRFQTSTNHLGEISHHSSGLVDDDRDYEKRGDMYYQPSAMPMTAPKVPAPIKNMYLNVELSPTAEAIRQPIDEQTATEDLSKVRYMHTLPRDALSKRSSTQSSRRSFKSPWKNLANYVNDLYSSEKTKKLDEYKKHAGKRDDHNKDGRNSNFNGSLHRFPSSFKDGCPHCRHKYEDYLANQNFFDKWWDRFKQKGKMPSVCKFGRGVLLFLRIILLPFVWPFKSKSLKRARQLIQFITYFPMMIYTALIQVFIFLLLVLAIFLIIYFWKLLTDPIGWIKGKALYLGHEGYCKVRYEFNKINVLPDLPDADRPYACPTSKHEKRAIHPYTERAMAAYDTASATWTLPSIDASGTVASSATPFSFPGSLLGAAVTSDTPKFNRRQYNAPSTRSTSHSTSPSISKRTASTSKSASSTSKRSTSTSISDSSLTKSSTGSTWTGSAETSGTDGPITTVHETVVATDTTTVVQTVPASSPEESSTKSVSLMRFTLDTSGLTESTTPSDLTATTSSAAANRRIELRWGRNAAPPEGRLNRRRLTQTTSTIRYGAADMMPPRDLSAKTAPPEDLDRASDVDKHRNRRQVQGKVFDLPAKTDARTTSQGQSMPSTTSFAYSASLDRAPIHTTALKPRGLSIPIGGITSAAAAVNSDLHSIANSVESHVQSVVSSAESHAQSAFSNIESHAQSLASSVNSKVDDVASSLKSGINSAVPSVINKGKEELKELGEEAWDAMDGLWDKVLKNLVKLFAKFFAIIPTNYTDCLGCAVNMGNQTSTSSVDKRAVLVTPTAMSQRDTEPTATTSPDGEEATMTIDPEEKKGPKSNKTKKPGDSEHPVPTESSSGAIRRFALPWPFDNLGAKSRTASTKDLLERDTGIAYLVTTAPSVPTTMESTLPEASITTIFLENDRGGTCIGVSCTTSDAGRRLAPAWFFRRAERRDPRTLVRPSLSAGPFDKHPRDSPTETTRSSSMTTSSTVPKADSRSTQALRPSPAPQSIDGPPVPRLLITNTLSSTFVTMPAETAKPADCEDLKYPTWTPSVIGTPPPGWTVPMITYTSPALATDAATPIITSVNTVAATPDDFISGTEIEHRGDKLYLTNHTSWLCN
ncbi:hypothetical protein BDV96DRAFT_655290 [Lophiotrema nucula]|uniref:Uncharacterized protein n=1 Tax=Lophiotrema nucula TaxID=690887 RepID=A0A6A5YI51_9PLEO|nr:hypothetical protein BDV96DRAFT_655290 [Lophiotrema nucula]